MTAHPPRTLPAAVTCGIVSDFSQCTIDCRMMTTISCIDDVTVQCVRDAACSEDCEALAACGYF